ncbi:type II secretion system protein N [Aquisalinus flavus]|uniref:Type II secretion system protein GspC N-terminal domain-containing protein n=1 Tax=Aquisalinus flavus TaxID=1526572 RepID=A0A8J2Y5N8_9PROT|nr:type II secretion system protein N [Aquisalinus flavus]MBD0427318.1 hypothetical protein [Aquisalinus flavus]GGD00048.1 hypothetical protein GCM10011342_06330 [Aquisalinus flavus]
MSIQTMQHDLIARLRRGNRLWRAGGNRNRSPVSGWLPRVVELVIVLLMAWLAVRLVYAFLAPPIPEIGETVATRNAAPLSADMSVYARFDPFAASAVDASAEPVIEARATDLDITLNGIWAEADGSGIAILKTGSTDQRMVEVGEEIMDGVTLDRLHPDRAIILRGGVRESVFLENRLAGANSSASSASRPAATPVNNPPVNDPPEQIYPESAGMSVKDLTTIVAVRPVRQGSEIVGYEVFPRNDGAVFSRLGFVEGDRILSINGEPAPANSERLLEMFEAMRSATSVSLVVDRGGERLNLTVNTSEF